MAGPIRFSFEGDQGEALRWRGAAQQALARQENWLRASGAPIASFRIELSPTAYAIGTIGPDYRSIHIVAPAAPIVAGAPKGMYFEFGSSGYPVVAGGAYSGCVVGVDISVEKGQFNLHPRIRGGARTTDLSGASAVGRYFDSKLIDGRVSYADEDGSGVFHRTLYTHHAASSPYTGIYGNSVNVESPIMVKSDLGDAESFTRRGTGFGPAFSFGEGDGVVTQATVPGADWPRATGVREVGGRLFGIYIDAFNKVFVFPVDSIVAGVATQVQSAEVPFPGWAFVPSAPASGQVYAAWKIGSPDLDWKLSHDGTKAAVVLHEREAVVWDDAYIADANTAIDSSPAKAAMFGETGAARMFDETVAVTELYTYGRGVFEIEIRIEVDGGAFTVALIGSDVRTPRGSDRGTFLVDYSSMNIKALDVQKGDLILFDIECWYEAGESIANLSPPFLCRWLNGTLKSGSDSLVESWQYAGFVDPYYGGTLQYRDHRGFPFDYLPAPTRPEGGGSAPFVTGESITFFSMRRRRAGVEVEVAAIPGGTIVGASLKTLSVAIGLEYEQRVQNNLAQAIEIASTSIPSTTTMTHVVSQPGVAIFTQGVLREVLLPDGIDSAAAQALRDSAELDPRDLLDTYTYMPANDLRSWSGLSSLRDFQLGMQRIRLQPNGIDEGRIKVLNLLGPGALHWPKRLSDNPIEGVTTEERNWWLAMCAHHSNTLLLLISNPNFGWAQYTSEIIHRTHVANATFFAHPNGSWAFYDQNRICNTYGWPALEEPLTAASRTAPLCKTPAQYWSEQLGAETPIFESTTVSGSNNDIWDFVFIPGTHISLPTQYFQMSKGVSDKGVGPIDSLLLNSVFGLDEVTGSEWYVQSVTVIDGIEYVVAYYIPTFRHVSRTIPRVQIVNIHNTYDSLTPAVEARGFRQVVFDRVHLKHGDVSLDTSFAALYADAIRQGVADDSDLREPVASELEATFTCAPTAYGPGLGGAAIEVTMHLRSGGDLVVTDAAYRNKYSGNTNSYNYLAGDAGPLLKYRLQRGATMPPTFSTRLLLDLEPI